MTSPASHAELHFPRPHPPEPGEIVDVAPGIRWLRMPLPFQLNHVNIYLVEDGDGWAVLDTGIAGRKSMEIWRDVIANRLQGRKLTRLILTHYHPDHIGLAGWFSGELGLEVWMNPTEHRHGRKAHRGPSAEERASHADFFRRHGLGEEAVQGALDRGNNYARITTELPERFHPLVDGDAIDLGGRRFEVLTGGGHAPEQVMLFCRDERLFLAADQVLARISPNVSVWPTEPDADPLQAYRTSLARLKRLVPDDVFAMPAHNLPFHGLHTRISQLERHHHDRCADIVSACASELTAAQILPVLFPRLLDQHQIAFAFGEVLAHINHLVATGELACDAPAGGRIIYRRT